MPFFRKKPVVIDAWQYFGYEDIGGVCKCEKSSRPHLHTMHKGQIVDLENGDWITKDGAPDTYYPIKDSVMQKTYDPV